MNREKIEVCVKMAAILDLFTQNGIEKKTGTEKQRRKDFYLTFWQMLKDLWVNEDSGSESNIVITQNQQCFNRYNDWFVYLKKYI